MRRALIGNAVLALLLTCGVTSVVGWQQPWLSIFAVLPNLPGNVPVSIEGLTVGPDGTVYAPSFGFNSKGEVKQPPHLFSFRPDGSLLFQEAPVSTAPMRQTN